MIDQVEVLKNDFKNTQANVQGAQQVAASAMRMVKDNQKDIATVSRYNRGLKTMVSFQTAKLF